MVEVTQKEFVEGYIESLAKNGDKKSADALRERLPVLQAMGLYDPNKKAEVDTDVAATAKGYTVDAAKVALSAAQAAKATADSTGILKDAAAQKLKDAQTLVESQQRGQVAAGKQVAQTIGLGPLMAFAEKGPAANSPLGDLIKNTPADALKDPKMAPLLKSIGDRVKSDPAFFATLDKQLSTDPKLSERFKKDLMEKPEAMALLVTNYKPASLGEDLSKVDGLGVVKVEVPKPPKPDAHHKPAAGTQPAAAPAGAAAQPVQPAAVVAGSATALAMATQLSESITKNFPELAKDSADFLKAIQTDPALQVRIKQQMDKNPDFLREIEGMKSDKPLPEGVKKSFRPFVQNMLHNPDDLGTDEGMKKTISGYNKAKSGATMAGASDWIKNNLGFDVSGIMSGLSGAFEGIGRFFKNLVNQFTGGNFMNMRNSGMGLGGAFMAAMDNASAMSRFGPEDVTAHPVLGADGKAFHKEKYYELNEQKQRIEKEREVPNTITVTSVNGTEHKVIPATGLQTVQDKQGNWHVAVATDINKNGSTKSMTADLVLSPVEYEKYKREAKLTAQDLGEVPYQQRMVTEINPRTGAASPAVEMQPAGMQPSGVETRPVTGGQATPVPLETEEEKRRRMGSGVAPISPAYSQA